MTAVVWIVGAGAVARMARLVALDSWPFDGIRAWLAPRSPWAHALVSCVGCVSVWLGAGWATAWWITDTAGAPWSTAWLVASGALSWSMAAAWVNGQ